MNRRRSRTRQASERRLIILGSGTGVPDARRRPAGYLLLHRGRGLLLDLGPGAWHAAHQYVAPGRIDFVLLSHWHVDHCLDTITMLFSLALLNRDMGLQYRPVLMGSPETLRQIERWVQATPGLPQDTVRWTPVWPGTRLPLWENVWLTVASVTHVAGSLAYRVDFDDGASMTYSGDTTWCHTLVQLAYRTSLLLLECAHREPTRPHLWPEAAARIARWAEARWTVLTHFYPDALAFPFRRRCRVSFRTPFSFARDGDSLPISTEGPWVVTRPEAAVRPTVAESTETSPAGESTSSP